MPMMMGGGFGGPFAGAESFPELQEAGFFGRLAEDFGGGPNQQNYLKRALGGFLGQLGQGMMGQRRPMDQQNRLQQLLQMRQMLSRMGSQPPQPFAGGF